MSVTPIVYDRSATVITRPSISLAGSPLYTHTAETTGRLMAGKMSVCIESAAYAPTRIMRIARHAVVNGRRSESLTIHIGQRLAVRNGTVTARARRTR